MRSECESMLLLGHANVICIATHLACKWQVSASGHEAPSASPVADVWMEANGSKTSPFAAVMHRSALAYGDSPGLAQL